MQYESLGPAAEGRRNEAVIEGGRGVVPDVSLARVGHQAPRFS